MFAFAALGLVAVGVAVAIWYSSFGRTWLLQVEYQSLYKARLQDLTNGRPDLELLATSLTNGYLCRFTQSHFWYVKGDGNPQEVPCGATPVAAGVAASSAFPPVFPPLTVSAQYFGQPNNVMDKPHRLTDGGVYDNLGLEAAFHRAHHRLGDASAPAEGDLVFVSDAEGPFDIEPASEHTWRNIRSTYILMWRLGNSVKNEHSPYVPCSIRDPV